MNDVTYDSIGIVFHKDESGNYMYESVEIFDTEEKKKKINDESVVIKLNGDNFSDLKDKKSIKVTLSDVENKEKLLMMLDSSVFDILLEECKSKGMAQEKSLIVIREVLDYISKNIVDIETKQHGSITRYSVKCVSEKEKDSEENENGEKKEKKIDMSKIDPDEIIEKIKLKVIGQDETVKSVINNIYNNQLMFDTENDDLINSKSHILLDGPTGTGKTMIIKEAARELSLPMVIWSAPMFSASGYKGADINEILVDLLKETKGDLETAQRGIVVLDEFDKLGVKGENGLEMKAEVQKELLTYFSGAKFPVEYQGKTYEFDTSKVTFICLGAFTDLRERKMKEELDNDGYYTMRPEDYIQEGLLRELVGRFSLLIATKSLSKTDLIKILKESIVSPLKQLKELGKLPEYNKEIVYSDEMIDKIATEAFVLDTGARSLSTIVNGIRNVILSELRDKTKDKIEITEMTLLKAKEVEKREGIRK